jgi:hypothetical protein
MLCSRALGILHLDDATNDLALLHNIEAALQSGKDTISGVVGWLGNEWKQFGIFEPDSSTGGTAEFLFVGPIFYFQRTA